MAAAKSKAKTDIVKTVLTWGHIITMSIIALAAVMNIGGLVALLAAPDVAEQVTEYAKAWQTLYIVGIAGYDAKATIENVMKINRSVQELKNSAEQDSGTTSNG